MDFRSRGSVAGQQQHDPSSPQAMLRLDLCLMSHSLVFVSCVNQVTTNPLSPCGHMISLIVPLRLAITGALFDRAASATIKRKKKSFTLHNLLHFLFWHLLPRRLPAPRTSHVGRPPEWSSFLLCFSHFPWLTTAPGPSPLTPSSAMSWGRDPPHPTIHFCVR